MICFDLNKGPINSKSLPEKKEENLAPSNLKIKKKKITIMN